MDIRKVRKLIELVNETGVAEIEIHEGEESVRINRGGINAPTLIPPPPPQPSTTPTMPAATSTPAAPAYQGDYVIKSPMVGTLYLTPSPDAPAFVKIGQKVKAGETICIIEAMKVFNPIETEKDGTVVECLVEHASPIEYDQPLFVIETN